MREGTFSLSDMSLPANIMTHSSVKWSFFFYLSLSKTTCEFPSMLFFLISVLLLGANPKAGLQPGQVGTSWYDRTERPNYLKKKKQFLTFTLNESCLLPSRSCLWTVEGSQSA